MSLSYEFRYVSYKKIILSLTLLDYFKDPCPLTLSFKRENILSYLSTELEPFASFGVLHQHIDSIQEIDLFSTSYTNKSALHLSAPLK